MSDGSASPTATVAVLFCDLVDSTARMSRLGDVRGDSFRKEFTNRLLRCVEESAGHVIKHLGDGLMVVFDRSTSSALACAHRMHLAFADFEEDDPVSLRIGLSVGEVASEDGDWFGTPVVESARLCSHAQPGQTLAPALVQSLVGSRAEHCTFTPIGPVQLKGLPRPVEAVSIEFEDEPPAPTGPDRPASETASKRRLVQVGMAIGALGTVLLGAFAACGPWNSGSDGLDTRAVSASTDPPSTSATVGYQPELVDAECDEATADRDSRTICKTLIVPESREDPDGPTIGVPVVGIANDDPQGPAALILDVYEPVTRSPLADIVDVWSLTPRGFGPDGSTGTLCPALAAAWEGTLALPSGSPDVLTTRADAAEGCTEVLDRQGWTREGYNLREMAADLRDLALALGEDQYVVASGGYFTPAATAFVTDHPDLVQSVLLSNPTPPGESVLRRAAANLEAHLGELSDLCALDDECRSQFPDLVADFEQRVDQLAAQPERVAVTALNGEGPFDVLLDDRRAVKALQAALQSTGQLGLVPAAITGAGPELLASAGILQDVQWFVGSTAIGPAILSSLCSYDLHHYQLSEVRNAGRPAYAGASDAWLTDVCSAWDVPSVFNAMDRPFRVDVPVLLAQGRFSIAGANEWAQSMSNLLPDATVVSFDTLSEDLVLAMPPCLGELRRALVTDPSSIDDDSVAACEKASPPIQFAPAPR